VNQAAAEIPKAYSDNMTIALVSGVYIVRTVKFTKPVPTLAWKIKSAKQPRPYTDCLMRAHQEEQRQPIEVESFQEHGGFTRGRLLQRKRFGCVRRRVGSHGRGRGGREEDGRGACGGFSLG
jgi:hypothetical protein